MDLDLDGLDAKLEAERARLVRALRSLADRVETLPVERVSEAVTFLAASVDALVRWADNVLGGVRGGSGDGTKRPGRS